ncbi:hypothetical protein E2C01_095395 [Portunus trituberculatus]|uniref:Uncharacterized protein n=1 Tax=Portunus trituberculatus TaxID=210409 RepID=A0A5B7K441_PORTR|nr:hypothetical protein [Portunus trituberculatus]
MKDIERRGVCLHCISFCFAAPFPPFPPFRLSCRRTRNRTPFVPWGSGCEGVMSEVSSFALAMLLEISGSCGVRERKKIVNMQTTFMLITPPSPRTLTLPLKEEGRHYEWDERKTRGRDVGDGTGGGDWDRSRSLGQVVAVWVFEDRTGDLDWGRSLKLEYKVDSGMTGAGINRGG